MNSSIARPRAGVELAERPSSVLRPVHASHSPRTDATKSSPIEPGRQSVRNSPSILSNCPGGLESRIDLASSSKLLVLAADGISVVVPRVRLKSRGLAATSRAYSRSIVESVGESKRLQWAGVAMGDMRYTNGAVLE
ncbi:hypothetical protein THAOC_23217, partial [Thalassiosira oceanica]